MTIQDLGSIGELVAAIATVATLVYLAIQIRSNTAVGRATGTVAQTTNIVDFSLLLAQNKELARIYFLGLSDPAALKPGESLQFEMAIGAYLQIVEQAYHLEGEGALSEGVWAHQIATLQWIVSQPGFADYWKKWGTVGNASSMKVVRELIAGQAAVRQR